MVLERLVIKFEDSDCLIMLRSLTPGEDAAELLKAKILKEVDGLKLIRSKQKYLWYVGLKRHGDILVTYSIALGNEYDPRKGQDVEYAADRSGLLYVIILVSREVEK